MKNIHILPTDKPSRLYLIKDKLKLSSLKFTNDEEIGWLTQNIYITSDEEIKEGDWLFNEEREPSVIKCIGKGSLRGWKKIILTTDQDLIKDGVQSIDDEFLEWFVKNPSCEFVEIVKYDGYLHFKYMIIIPKEEPKQCKCGSNWVNTTNKDNPFCFHCGKPLTQEPKQIKCYCGHTITCDCDPLEEPKQEISDEAKQRAANYMSLKGALEPKDVVLGYKTSLEAQMLDKIGLEEPKQETLEEAAKNTTNKYINEREKQTAYLEFIEGAKWQAERMYNEHEALKLLNKYNEYLFTFIDKDVIGIGVEEEDVINWFEQHKKK
jgi:hypothetical protein